jgi:hypothetical protein
MPKTAMLAIVEISPEENPTVIIVDTITTIAPDSLAIPIAFSNALSANLESS